MGTIMFSEPSDAKEERRLYMEALDLQYKRHVAGLIEAAWRDGIVIEVTLESQMPLAMGRYMPVISSRFKR